MIRDIVTRYEVIELLNELIEKDQVAIQTLFENRVVCNKVIAEHPTVQVSDLSGTEYLVGMIGVLNGLFGITKNGSGGIVALYEEDKLVKFLPIEETLME